jgi:hypothetical protein
VESQEATVALQRALVAHANQLESLKVSPFEWGREPVVVPCSPLGLRHAPPRGGNKWFGK